MGILEIIGLITVLIITLIIIATLTLLIVGYVLIKKNKILFPKLALFLLDNFYSILLRLFLFIGSEETFYRIGIEFYNKYYEDKFKSTNKKILILPHCLRDAKCPAKLSPNGIECVMCGKCVIGEILKRAKSLGYEVYIVPGSTFLKRILKNDSGVFGVACYKDLFYGMNYLSRKSIPMQGQPLLKDGCLNTIVDVDELLNRLENLR
ncbi:hypothetical protein J422_06075 [Methanocaldococcus villosus KIN24-T80]|uniref:Polyprenyl synthetase n=1 Tax=Methanocaldococcus villosus KIN24-T80 TaxID=1069083 RepID=N6VPD9_9EURY|nr:DUF116 domain-containing protein [Methanocaldococcus villosus]ENN95745.1 hypothetical protein J422_06075 [Methanocaldococcus villosus KIN24-T80]